MGKNLPQAFDPEAPVFPVSVAAQLADMHPQTLRGYDRLGLVVPKRSRGRGRRYSLKDVAKLRHIQHLSQNEGINLEGIRRILALEAEIDTLNTQIERLGKAVRRLQSFPLMIVHTFPPHLFRAGVQNLTWRFKVFHTPFRNQIWITTGQIVETR